MDAALRPLPSGLFKASELPTRGLLETFGCERKGDTGWRWDCESRQASRTLALMRAIVESLCDADSAFARHDLGDFLPLWELRKLDSEEFVAAAKYLLAWPMARWQRNDCPRCPSSEAVDSLKGFKDWPLMFVGRARRHMKNLLASRTSSAQAGKVMLALLQGAKRGCEEVDSSVIEAAMFKHMASMTSSAVVPSVERQKIYREKFAELWRHKADKARCWRVRETHFADPLDLSKVPVDLSLYRWRNKPSEWPIEPMQLGNPSNHACLEATRSDGGRAGEIWRTLGPTVGLLDETRFRDRGEATLTHLLDKEIPRTDFTSFDSMDDLLSAQLYREECARREEAEEKSKVDKSIRTARRLIAEWLDNADDGDLRWMREVRPGVVKEVRGSRGRMEYADVLRIATSYIHRYPTLLAEVHPILEPLKVRLITKGPTYPYWAASAAQKLMWRHLKEKPQLALIGRTLDESDLWGLLGKGDKLCERHQLEPFTHWVSGDYAAATDGLSTEINQLAFGEFLKQVGAVPSKYNVETLLGSGDVWKAVLAPHVLTYAKQWFDDGERRTVEQKNGQLMGSPVSFPILCAVNIVAFWIALEEWTGKTIALEDLPVLVNGDDILFRCCPALYAIWQRVIVEAGFTLSLGKNYISKELISINSEFFLDLGKGAQRHFRKLGFLNVGLLGSGHAGEYQAYSQAVQEIRHEVGLSKHPPRVVPIALRPENRMAPWVDRASRVINECNDPVRAHKRVMHHFRREIALHSNHGELNLCAAPELGGLGLTHKGACDLRFTAFQRKLAEHCLKRSMDLNGTYALDRDAAAWHRFGTLSKSKAVESADPAGWRGGTLRWIQSFEPLRENEREIMSGKSLENYLVSPNNDAPTWRVRWLTSSEIKAFRAENNSLSGINRPVYWDRRLVIQSPVQCASGLNLEHNRPCEPVPMDAYIA
jgi:hypothetical protein